MPSSTSLEVRRFVKELVPDNSVKENEASLSSEDLYVATPGVPAATISTIYSLFTSPI